MDGKRTRTESDSLERIKKIYKQSTIKRERRDMSSAHYSKTKIEAIELIEELSKRESLPRGIVFAVGNALKYILRAGEKEGESWQSDLAKAENYLHRALTGEWKN